jgi:opacity protein-like surface antigen
MKKFLVIFAVVALLASPAMAAEWNFYGSARMSTFSERCRSPQGC